MMVMMTMMTMIYLFAYNSALTWRQAGVMMIDDDDWPSIP